ncbi:Uncharacterised protein [Serratia fonticola]|uniref:hypothetical protein n=1 Tax=Serratia fonticola TaxID=47917 RepID=UPI002178E9D3|nr:hypothetical protein [Serratia fonticola]CAI0758603.1 Uncharacterised protein [Serratia fonticola]
MNDFIAWLRQQLSQAAAAPRYIQLANSLEIAIKQRVLGVGDFYRRNACWLKHWICHALRSVRR